MFPLRDGWFVAHLLGHEAFKYLGAAMNENLRIHNMYPKLDDINPLDALFIGNEIKESYECEVTYCIHSVVIFQSAMEAWINYALEHKPLKSLPKKIKTAKGTRERNFIEKWTHAFKYVEKNYDFSVYTELYRKYRNAIVHPTNKKRCEIIENLNSKIVYLSFYNAWHAMAELSAEIDQKFDEGHWETMCRTNNVPFNHNNKLKNTNILYEDVFKMHLDYLSKSLVNRCK